MIKNKRETVNFEKNSQNRFSFGGSDDEAGLIQILIQGYDCLPDTRNALTRFGDFEP